MEDQKYYRIYIPEWQKSQSSPDKFRFAPRKRLDDLHDFLARDFNTSIFESRLNEAYKLDNIASAECIYGYDFIREVKLLSEIHFDIDEYRMEFVQNYSNNIFSVSRKIEYIFQDIHATKYVIDDGYKTRCFIMFDSIDKFTYLIDGRRTPLKCMSPFIEIRAREDGIYRIIPYLAYHIGSSVMGMQEEYTNDVVTPYLTRILADFGMIGGKWD